MLQAQGLRPSDPYRTLQLHPSAPRELVSDVYWALIERAKHFGSSSSAHNSTRIAELNDAYRLLSDPSRRAAYDEDNGLAGMKPPHVTVNRPLVAVPFLAEIKLVSDHQDLYHLLRVDGDADTQVVDIAYRTISRSVGTHSAEDAFLRGLLDEAHRTLSNRELRAQYDQKLAKRGRRPSVAEPSSPDAPVAAPQHEAARPAEVTAPIEASTDDRQTEVGRTAIIRPAQWFAASSAAPVDAPVADSESTHPGRPTSGAASDVSAADQPAANAAAAPPAPLVAAAIVPEVEATPPHQTGTESRLDATQDSAPDTTPTAAAQSDMHRSPSPSPEPRRGLFARLRGGRSDAQASRAAANERADERLLTLGGFDARPGTVAPAPAATEPSAPERALAELVVIAGTHAGLRVPLGEQSITLTAGVGTTGDEIARVWPYGDSFALRVVGDAPVRINGESLVLPVVMLDDGDEIDTGSQTLAFHRLPAPN